MVKIQIVKIPPGEAPLEIRQKWVGLEMPLVEQPDSGAPQIGALGGPPTPANLNGFEVHGADALRALEEAGHADAARWWREESALGPGHLVFAKDVCTLIQDADEDVPLHGAAGSDDIPF